MNDVASGIVLRRRALLAAAATSLAARPARAATATPLRIGVLTDLSGPFASIVGPGAVEAARLAAEEVGDVLGRPVEILAADHQNKPDVGSAIVRRWFDVEGVEAITELVGSAVAMAVLDVARQHGRIALVSGAGSSDITGAACGPTIFQWTWDTFSLARGTVQALMEFGGRDWFFLTADYALGHAQERDSTLELQRRGGRVVGSVKVPVNTTDFSAFLLQAAGSGANVLALATAAGTATALKQAKEFGLSRTGLAIVPLQLTLAEAHGLGLETVQGAQTLAAFYWDRTAESRAWSQAFYRRTRAMPTDMQAGVYSAVRHYLACVRDVGITDGMTVARRMRERQVQDAFCPSGMVRADGKMVHDMYFVQAKAPARSKGEWDLFEVKATLAGEAVVRPLGEGGCRLR